MLLSGAGSSLMLKSIIAILCYVLLAVPAFCSVPPSPSFNPVSSIWFSSHIVVARITKTFDGSFTVLESLKGNLKKDDTIWIPELAIFAEDKQRRTSELFGKKTVPCAVTGQRMILFLRRMEYPWRIENGRREEWLAANRDGMFGLSKTQMDISVAWIEEDVVYSRHADSFAGGYSMQQVFLSESKAREAIKDILEVRNRFDVALVEKDTLKRTQAMCSLLSERHPKYPLLSYIAWQSLVEDRNLLLDFIQKSRKVTPELEDQTVKMLEAFQKNYDQQLAHDKQVISIFDPTALLKALQRAAVGWRDPKEKPPPPYEYFIELWGSVCGFLMNFIDNKPMMREMSLNERKELLSIAEEILQYLNKMPPNVYYRDDLRWRCEKVIKELRPAVPPKGENNK
ncbi:MAG: hypothetical protein QM703_17250 [Gemmatales bacterium]